jgi:hypothetical protein
MSPMNADCPSSVALELAQQGLHINESPIQNLLRKLQQVFQQWIDHRVSRCHPALLRDDDPTGSQACQLLRHDRLTDSQGFL